MLKNLLYKYLYINMSYNNIYKVNDVDITTIFKLRSTIPSGDDNPTGFKINGIDLYNILQPSESISPSAPFNTFYYKEGTTDLSQIFEPNLINESLTTVSYTEEPATDGILIKITSGGNIAFNTDINDIRIILVGGGGGGGGSYVVDPGSGPLLFGAGGGAGEVCDGTISITKTQLANITIGDGGSGGIGRSTSGDSTGTNGGQSQFIIDGSTNIIVSGGGAGGGGENNGLNGGSGGGSGGYRPGSTQTIAGTSNKNTNTPPLFYFGSNGANGTENNNGVGGGGGGASQNGGQSPIPSGGGAGYLITIGTSHSFSVGGGGAGAIYTGTSPSGGAGGGGNGGSADDNAPTPGQTNTGGGGGGASVGISIFGAQDANGARGGSGVCYLYIQYNNINY